MRRWCVAHEASSPHRHMRPAACARVQCSCREPCISAHALVWRRHVHKARRCRPPQHHMRQSAGASPFPPKQLAQTCPETARRDSRQAAGRCARTRRTPTTPAGWCCCECNVRVCMCWRRWPRTVLDCSARVQHTLLRRGAALTQAQAGAVLDDGVGAAAQALQQEGARAGAVVGGDEPQRVQRAALAVGRARVAVAWQVGSHERLACGV